MNNTERMLTRAKELNAKRTQYVWNIGSFATRWYGLSKADAEFLSYMANNAGALIEEIERLQGWWQAIKDAESTGEFYIEQLQRAKRRLEAAEREIEQEMVAHLKTELRLRAAERVILAMKAEQEFSGWPLPREIDDALEAYDAECQEVSGEILIP